MPLLDVSQIKYAGSKYSSVVIVDDESQLRVAPSLYLADLSVNGDSLHTIQNYGYRLNTFFDVIKFSSIGWKEIQQKNIDAYINKYLSQRLNLSEKSINGHVAAISGFFDYAWKYGFLDAPMSFKYNIVDKGVERNPRQTSRDSPTNLIEKYIAHDKFLVLVESVEAQSDYIQERNELVLYIGYYMGLRAAEVVDPRNLLLSKLLNPSGEIADKVLIVGKGKKTRSVIISFALKEKIKKFLKGRRKGIPGCLLVCSKEGQALNRAFPSKLFSDAASNSQDGYLTRRSFHSLRHTFATNLVVSCNERGIDPWTVVPEQMGHEDFTTTFEYIYFEAVLNKRHSQIKKLSIQARNISKKRKFKSEKNL